MEALDFLAKVLDVDGLVDYWVEHYSLLQDIDDWSAGTHGRLVLFEFVLQEVGLDACYADDCQVEMGASFLPQNDEWNEME